MNGDIMKKTYKILLIYLGIVGALSALGAALRTAALFGDYDAAIGYYRTSAVLPDVFHVLTVVSVVIALALVLFLRGKTLKSSLPTLGAPSKISALTLMIALAALALYYMYLLAAPEKAVYGSVVSGASSAVWVIAFICAIPGVIYFLALALGKKKKGEAQALLGFFVIFFVLMSLAATYFDFTTAMNSPNKLLLQVSYMAVMIYMLFELRYFLGRAKPKAYGAVSLAALYLCFTVSVPGIIAFFAGIFTKLDYFFCHFFMLCFGVYILARYVSFAADEKNAEKI